MRSRFAVIGLNRSSRSTLCAPISLIPLLYRTSMNIVALRGIQKLWWVCKAGESFRLYSVQNDGKMMVGIGVLDKQESDSDSLQAKKEEMTGLISGDGRLSCGYSSFRGRRLSMEDFYDVKSYKINGKAINMFGIFYGHGGPRAAEYLKEHLFINLMNHPLFITNTKKATCESFQKTDSEFLDSQKAITRDDGSTASTAVFVGNHLFVANVGDSRTVISKAGRAIALSEDHKPNRVDERKRIEDAGGIIMWTGTWRVGGVLAMSRAFGNRMLKQ